MVFREHLYYYEFENTSVLKRLIYTHGGMDDSFRRFSIMSGEHVTETANQRTGMYKVEVLKMLQSYLNY